MQHSQSDVALSTNGTWSELKNEGLKKRSNTAQNLQFYVEEQKRLYNELPFFAIPGMRRQSFQRERSYSNIKSQSSWGSFTNLLHAGEDQPLVDKEIFPEPGYTLPLLLSCCVALLSAFQFGYNTGVTGAINPSIVFPGHSSIEWALCVSMFAIGGPVGSIVAGPIATYYGRKKTLLIDAMLFIIAGLVMTMAFNIYMLIVGRFIVGFAAGAVSVVVPLYLGELAPPNLRGALGTGYQFGVVIGIFIADLLAFIWATPSLGWEQPGWRLLLGFTIIPGLLQLALAGLLTESPRWLLTKNRPKEAADILRRLRAEADVYEEIDSICAANEQERMNRSGGGRSASGGGDSDHMGFWEVLSDRSIRFPLIVGIVLQVAQQFSGVNAVMFYASLFFENVGLQQPLVGVSLVGLINVVSTGVALTLMDSAGRRPLLIYSCLGMVASGIVLTVGLCGLIPYANLVAVGSVMCFVWFFEIGIGPIPWLIVAEMFPAQPRATAMSIATVVNWLCGFLVGISFPMMQTLLGNFTFVPFIISSSLVLLFVLRYVPETKGKTIDEIRTEMQNMK